MQLLPEVTSTFVIWCVLIVYTVHHYLFVYNHPLYTPVDIVLYDDRRTELVISGIDRAYSLELHVVFVDSWITATSGLMSFHTDQSLGTVIRPYPYSPSVWIVRRMFLFPLHVTGIIPDTLVHEILITDVKQPIDTVDSVIRVYITPAQHTAEILSVSAYYMPENSVTWVNFWTICYTIMFYRGLATVRKFFELDPQSSMYVYLFILFVLYR